MSTIKKNFIFKLLSNSTNAIVNGLIYLFLPRLLGPFLYGQFSFLNTFFRNSIQFFDLFISPGFYVLYNKEKSNDLPLFSYYYFIISLFLNFLFVTIIILNPDIKSYVFVKQNGIDIYLALFLSLLNWLIIINSYIFDANNKTVYFEIKRFFSKIILIITFLFLLFFDFLTITTAFSIFIFSALYLVSLSLNKSRELIKYKIKNAREIILKSFKKVFNYNSPLILFSIIALTFTQLEILIINYYYGAKEFSFFALSVQIGSLLFVFTASLVPLIIKKYVDDIKFNNYNSISLSFSQEVSYLFYVITFLSIFVAVHSYELIFIIAGQEYLEGIHVFIIYSIYPMHQTLGQISSAYFLASEKVKLYAKINIVICSIGFIFSIFLIMPKSLGGLELGSLGLSVKMVLVQLFSVYFLLFIIYKSLKMNFFKLIFNHFKIISIISLVIICVNNLTTKLFDGEITILLFGFVIDFLILSFLFFKFQHIFGFKNLEFKFFINSLKKKIK